MEIACEIKKKEMLTSTHSEKLLAFRINPRNIILLNAFSKGAMMLILLMAGPRNRAVIREMYPAHFDLLTPKLSPRCLSCGSLV